jgi:hypothetical protein
MVLRHYGVATRLLDWSKSPCIAAYFATVGDAKYNGEIWAFDEPLYEEVGAKQWEPWGGKRPYWTAFSLREPTDWFVCQFYQSYQGFPRLEAQQGAFTMTARFGRDHAKAIAHLFAGHPDHYRRYVIPGGIKRGVRQVLRDVYGVWRGTLFPDSAGAAGTVREEMPDMCV